MASETPPRTLLIVEDDRPFLQRLARAMETRGFTVQTAETVAEGIKQVEAQPARLTPWSTFGSRTATALTSSRRCGRGARIPAPSS